MESGNSKPQLLSLCATCEHVRRITSGTGSKFLLCQLAQTNRRFVKYPPQPVIRCEGYEDARRAKDAE